MIVYGMGTARHGTELTTHATQERGHLGCRGDMRLLRVFRVVRVARLLRDLVQRNEGGDGGDKKKFVKWITLN